MGYCPNCGSNVHSDEVFCVTCGEKLPADLDMRNTSSGLTKKSLWLPFGSLAIMSLVFLVIWVTASHNKEAAIDYYHAASDDLLLGNYAESEIKLDRALHIHPQFDDATVLKDVAEIGSAYQSIQSESVYSHETIQQLDNYLIELEPYQGEIADQLRLSISDLIINLRLDDIELRLESTQSVPGLQAILWELEGIASPKALELTQTVKEQLSVHMSSLINNHMTNHQFNEAKQLIETGLNYLPEDDRLLSLKQTVETEQKIFEASLEERMEQAFSQYYEDQEINANDAVDLINISLNTKENGQLYIEGTIKSIATVPIYNVRIHYQLIDENDARLDEHQIYVYPEELFPNDEGQFDFTYLSDAFTDQNLEIEVTSITWLLDKAGDDNAS
ncbi:hypothetical protein DES38_102237 [Streptohalobacillus salinus]|uniref:Zinc-ribbon domain-containing protein n=1 Tax=Streptohalobacillus salinus TaxID=621096 RepID=A0A2V3WDP8_9BACI|nr:FxLYD domain-containing protein [Streptohalobacillus salinus]PXW92653.1 hypothetical protein DES38_102237 [Streptohalobacillus salinus]